MLLAGALITDFKPHLNQISTYMKKSLKRIAIFGAGAIGALTAAMATVPKAQVITQQVQEQKAARLDTRTKKTVHVENHRSGLDLVTYWPNVGLSPKAYGQLYGCKKHGRKTNFKRLSHNAKVRRR